MKNLFSFILILLCFSTSSTAQEHNHSHAEPCGLDTYSKQLYEQNPDAYLAAEAHTNEQINKWIAANKENLNQKKAEIITIPIVFHVVWSNNRPESNISDEQIYSQIEALNRDFRKLNDLSGVRDIFKDRVADMEIEFRLAEFDPDGNLTTGITRTETSVEEWTIGSDMKYTVNGGKDPWPSPDYLNIWIISRLAEGEVAGYAQPGSSFPANARTDGVVMLYNYTGQIGEANPNDFGRTGTHEVGHWLNLRHLWGMFNQGDETPSCYDEDDGVDDTPFTADANFGCNFNRNQCTQETPDFPDMIENYMDYANGSCQAMFTHGQKERAMALLNTSRVDIATSPGLRARGENDVMITNILNPTNNQQVCTTFEPVIEVINFGTENMVYFEIDYTVGGQNYSHQWVNTDPNSKGIIPWGTFSDDGPKTIAVTLPAVTLDGSQNEYDIEVTLKRPNGALQDFDDSDNTLSASFKTVSPGVEPYLNENFQFVVFPPIGWSVFNGDNHPHWRFKGTKDANLEVGYNDTQAALMDNFAYEAVGEIDELIFPALNFEEGFGKMSLSFYHAYCYMDENSVSDTLSILISEDCGNSFTPVAKLFGEDLTTATPNSGPFIPAEGEWKQTNIDLSSYVDLANHVVVKFSQTRGSGNNLYIDEVDLFSVATNIDPVLDAVNELKLFPNPTNHSFQLQFEAEDATNLQLDILDKAGRKVRSQNIAANSGLNQHEILLENLPTGIYFVRLQDGSQVSTQKLVVF